MAKKTKAEALKTRQLLIETAIIQFATRGVANTTLNDIADAAGYTGRYLLAFWQQNAALQWTLAAAAPLRDLIQDRLTLHISDNPLQQLREKLIVGLQYIAEIPRQQALLQILYHKCEFHEGMISEQEIREKIGFSQKGLRDALQASMTEGLISRTTDLDVVLIIIHGSFSGIVKNWLMSSTRYDLYQQAPALVDNVLRMLVPDGNVLQLTPE